jgi:hypothetical protein
MVKRFIAISALGLSLSFAGGYVNNSYLYFSAGYDYGKCFKLSKTVNIKGYAFFIPVKDEKVLAYYHYLLKSHGLTPIVVPNGILAYVTNSKKDPNIVKIQDILLNKLKLKPKLIELIGMEEGYLFDIDMACAKGEKSPFAYENAMKKKNHNVEKPKEKKQLPIDRVIADIKKAISDAEKIGEEEPANIRTVYKVEFDKEKLIKDLQTILNGLKQFKKQVETKENLN